LDHILLRIGLRVVGQIDATVGEARTVGDLDVLGIRAEQVGQRLADLDLKLGAILELRSQAFVLDVAQGSRIVRVAAAGQPQTPAKEGESDNQSRPRSHAPILPVGSTYPGGEAGEVFMVAGAPGPHKYPEISFFSRIPKRTIMPKSPGSWRGRLIFCRVAAD